MLKYSEVTVGQRPMRSYTWKNQSLIGVSNRLLRRVDADAASAKYTGSPDGLISALGKLERGVERVPMDATPATAHLFIVNPLSGGGLSRLFSTHPPIEERIRRLEAMAQGT